MIHLEDAQSRMRIPIGECVESGAYQNILPHSASHSLSQFVLGEMTANRSEEAQHPLRTIFSSGVTDFIRVRSKNLQRQRIFEDQRRINKLMRCTQDSNGNCRTAGPVVPHSFPA